ncbi:MAG: hypothetical protein HRU19_18450 [Pseudobacteriovorax sp.]|nr:hypothetical protein [Pseudobacteriovorax sp.]
MVNPQSSDLANYLKEQFADDLDILEEFFSAFSQAKAGYKQKLNEAYLSGNIAELGEICHEIKGVISNLGQSECWHLLQNTEQSIAEGTYGGNWNQEHFEQVLEQLSEDVRVFIASVNRPA